jgi:integrase
VKNKISFNPNDATEPIGKDEPEIEYLTPEEIPDMLNEILSDYWIHAFIVALGTGLRVGELAGLMWGDVNLTKGHLDVCRTISRVNTYATEGLKTKLIIQTPKTKKSFRRVPLPLDVIKALKAVQTRQREHKGNVIELNSEDYVFSWPDGRMIDPNYLSKHFKKLVEKVGSKDVHFHSLRHSYATLLLSNGEELKVIQENLGLKDIKTTSNMYTHVIEKLKERSAQRLNGFTQKKKAHG